MLIISYDKKCTVKAEIPRNTLARVPKSKACSIATSVEIKTADRDSFMRSNVAPSTIFIINIPNDYNL